MMIDNRCPSCNEPVTGRAEILKVKPAVPKKGLTCQHCKTQIRLVKGDQDIDLVDFYFEEAK
jgi:hypothetical protein